MRSIDKAMLLAEYFSINTSNGVSSFKKWLKKEKIYTEFNDKLHELKMTKSLKGKAVYEYAKYINIDKAHSMEECFIIYGRMNYILKITDKKYYANPLLIEKDDENKTTLGELKIFFDEKLITLDEFSTSLGYSFELKKEYIKNTINAWIDEVNEYITKPMHTFDQLDNYLSPRKIVSIPFIIQSILVLFVLGFETFVYFTSIESLHMIVTNQYGEITGLFYYLLLTFGIFYLVELIVIFVWKFKKYHEYQKHLKSIAVIIDDEVVSAKNNIYEYMLKQITTNSKFDAPINRFNDISRLNAPVYYFNRRYAMNKKISFSKTTLAEKCSFGLYVLLIIAFLIILFVSKGGM